METETKRLKRQTFVRVPNAPSFRGTPFGEYCYFVPSGVWTAFDETEFYNHEEEAFTRIGWR